jgi:hypothetical protein
VLANRSHKRINAEMLQGSRLRPEGPPAPRQARPAGRPAAASGTWTHPVGLSDVQTWTYALTSDQVNALYEQIQ